MDYEKLRKYNLAEIQTAGPRYTPGQDPKAPNLHIEELEDAFNALCFSNVFREKIQKFKTDLNKKIADATHVLNALFKQKKRKPSDVEVLLEKLEKSSPTEAQKIINQLQQLINSLSNSIRKRELRLYEIERKEREKKSDKGVSKANYERHQLNQFEEVLGRIRYYFSSAPAEFIKSNCVLVLGEWGTGKTHFLCDFVKTLSANNHVAVFALAQNFPLATNPSEAIVKRCGLAKDLNALLLMLEKDGVKNRRRSLLIIDGINEGDREHWKIAVKDFLKILKNYPHVGLVLSCRTPFEKIIFNIRSLKKYKKVVHRGFSEIEFEAQEEFFKYYKIPFPEIPLLSDEFSRPLTLKLICKALGNLTQKKKRATFAGIASGQKGMTYILEEYIKNLGKDIETKYKLPGKFCWWLLKGTKSTKNNLEDGIAIRLATQQKEVLSHDETIEIILNTTQWTSKKEAEKLLKELIHNGILFEHYIWTGEKYIDAVRLPYQRFSDHIIARHLIDKYLNKKSITSVAHSFYKGRPLGAIFEIEKYARGYKMPNWAEALMVEFPESIKRLPTKNRELIFYLPKNKRLIEPSLEPFLNSLIWRSPQSFCIGTDSLINQLLDKGKPYTKHEVFNALLALSVKTKHPYNSSRMNKYLSGLQMPVRDRIWSEFLRRSYNTSTPYKIISWSIAASKHNVSKETAKHCITMLMWFLTSVSKPQRDRATEALVRLGSKHPSLLFSQAIKSFQIDDPYISERMLAASYGVAMNKWAEKNKRFEKPFIEFAKNLVQEMFLPKAAYGTHNAISRDSALGCIEIARMLKPNCIATRYRKFLKPPFSQIKSPFRAVDKIKEAEIEAVKPALQMDFRNYTLGRLVPGRGNYQDNHDGYQSVLKQIKGRIYDLGYRWEDFKEIDREIPQMNGLDRSEKPTKVDRYGKKYSWIAYYEMYGFREVNGFLSEDRIKERMSDISMDPSIPEAPLPWFPKLPNVFSKESKGFADWMMNGVTPNYSGLLVLDRIRGKRGPWVLIDGFINQTNPNDPREIFSFLRGLFIKNENLSQFKKRYFSIEYPGNDAIRDFQTDHYTFAGEIPWSKNHAPYLRYADGRPKRCIEVAFSEHKFLPSKKQQKEELETNNARDLLLLNLTRKGKWIRTPGVEIEIPIHSYGWESYHSIVNDYSGFHIPAPAISDYLGLNYRNHSVELFDRQGKKATAYLSSKDDEHFYSSKLLYLRKDLLERYLSHTNQVLIWAIWGERDINYKLNEQRNADANAHGVYEKHQQIHRSLTAYKDGSAHRINK